MQSQSVTYPSTGPFHHCSSLLVGFATHRRTRGHRQTGVVVIWRVGSQYCRELWRVLVTTSLCPRVSNHGKVRVELVLSIRD